MVRTPLAIRVTLGLGGEPSEADAIVQDGMCGYYLRVGPAVLIMGYVALSGCGARWKATWARSAPA